MDRDKQQKSEIRTKYRNIRKNIDKNYSSYAAESLVNIFLQNLNYVTGRVISAYIPMDGEIDVIPLMRSLLYLNYEMVIPNKNGFVTFNRPNKNMMPDTLIIPMIAFDDHFHRLGFGSGWYDKIMKLHRKTFIGVAYEEQLHCKALPIEEHDQKLDIIITEVGIRLPIDLPILGFNLKHRCKTNQSAKR